MDWKRQSRYKPRTDLSWWAKPINLDDSEKTSSKSSSYTISLGVAGLDIWFFISLILHLDSLLQQVKSATAGLDFLLRCHSPCGYWLRALALEPYWSKKTRGLRLLPNRSYMQSNGLGYLVNMLVPRAGGSRLDCGRTEHVWLTAYP